MKFGLTILGLFILASGNAAAGDANVTGVIVKRQGPGGAYRITVSVRHGDTGWQHYADRWEVVAPDGTVLGTRVLLHPHVREQPFTRSLGGVKIPEPIKRVTIRAHAKPHGYGGKTKMVDVPR